MADNLFWKGPRLGRPHARLRPVGRLIMAAVSLMTVATLWPASPALAQLPEPVGNFVRRHAQPAGSYKLEANNAVIRLDFYSPAVVRVRVGRPNQAWDTLSFAVIARPDGRVRITESETDAALTLRTDSITLEVTKRPMRVRLLTRDGRRVVCEDEPGFGTVFIGEEIGTYKTLQPGERFIGLGEKTGPLDRRGNGYTNWNTDAFGYSSGQDPIYQSIPFYMGLHQGLAYGVFFDNAHRSHMVMGASSERFSSFSAEAGEMDYYLIHHRSVAKIIESYTMLTGRMPLPPLWGLGLQQARYSYYPESRVRAIARTYRERGIPADGIVLDIHYMDKYKIFTWDPVTFPDPKRLVSDLRSQGFRTITIHDPGIKVEPGYRGYDDGIRADIFAKYPDGKYHISNVWPGRCHFPEFGRRATKDYWQQSLKYSYTDYGVEGFWNDMNEPATWGNRFPNVVNFRVDGPGGRTDTISHRRMHNLYGLLMSQTSYQVGRELLGRRPFILTRAGYAGIQRYSAVWTGDNRSEEDHMIAGVRLLNAMGLSGVPYTGMDVGGFTGNPTGNLFARWVSIGAFSPFFRIHTAINTRESDPWSFGEVVESVSKSYIRLRYRMLPYLYSAFYEASQTGLPINRSLAIDYTHDPRTYDGTYENQFFFGPSILVAPAESHRSLTKVFLPGNTGYYDLYTGRYYTENQIIVDSPLERLPVFVKGGAIIPMQGQVMHTGERAQGDTLYLHVYEGAGRPSTQYTYYEDDGESFGHEQGQYYRQVIRYDGAGRRVTFDRPEGSFQSRFKTVKVLFHTADAGTRQGTAGLSGRRERVRFVEGLPFFDPIGEGQQHPESPVYSYTAAMPTSGGTINFGGGGGNRRR